jgi:hypothetical protein
MHCFKDLRNSSTRRAGFKPTTMMTSLYESALPDFWRLQALTLGAEIRTNSSLMPAKANLRNRHYASSLVMTGRLSGCFIAFLLATT